MVSKKYNLFITGMSVRFAGECGLENFILLLGGAGVGKSFLVKRIIQLLRDDNRNFAVCASTGLCKNCFCFLIAAFVFFFLHFFENGHICRAGIAACHLGI